MIDAVPRADGFPEFAKCCALIGINRLVHALRLVTAGAVCLDAGQGQRGFLLERKATLLSLGVMRKIGYVLALALLLCACQKREENARLYDVRGIVRGFSPDRTTIEIEHENIRGFMPQMTMPFTPRDKKEIANLANGDAVSFRLHVTANDSWIDGVKKIPREEVALNQVPSIVPTAANSERLHEGDALPPFRLTNENGEQIAPEDFRGGPLVMTFIFTRCALPKFCPLMSQNFFAIQDAHAHAHLLSVTLDPSFDTPPILKQYAAFQHADPAVWNFATGDKTEVDRLAGAFSVYRENEGGTLSHGLATALIDRDGKITKIWRGNSWKTAEVIEAIKTLQN